MPPPADVLASRLAAARRRAHTPDHDGLLLSSPVSLRYLFGVPSSAGIAVLGPDVSTVIVDARYLEAFQAAALPAVEVVEVPVGRTYEAAACGAVAAQGLRRVGVEADTLTIARLGALRGAVAAPVEFVETHGLVAALRAVKDSWELAVFREAGRRLSAVAACILPKVSDGCSEREIAWEIEMALHDAGFDGPAFEPIVASGPNGARPHHRAGDRVIRNGDLVVVDFGGRLDGYAVDMTRTVAVGHIDAERRSWLQAVGEAQRAAIAAAAPGVAPSEVDRAARRALAGRDMAEAFVHSTGHGLGLEVHERPWIAPRGDADGRLEAGMVFTVEPGVYYPGRGGVRIEDDVVVTVAGVECLTSAPPAFEAHES
jgi:Xaa-Pro aminopeptidase